jgi:hypothetical protein
MGFNSGFKVLRYFLYTVICLIVENERLFGSEASNIHRSASCIFWVLRSCDWLDELQHLEGNYCLRLHRQQMQIAKVHQHAWGLQMKSGGASVG